MSARIDLKRKGEECSVEERFKTYRATKLPVCFWKSNVMAFWCRKSVSYVIYEMHFYQCYFWCFFFSDTVLLVLLWVLTKKRLMNIKYTNFTANRLQYTCYIQFLLAYLHTFFSSDLEQCPGLNNKKLFLLSGYTYYFQLMQVDRSEPK